MDQTDKSMKSAEQSMAKHVRQDEGPALDRLLYESPLDGTTEVTALRYAQALLSEPRRIHSNTLIDNLLGQFPLASVEGRALMGLTEALLRTDDRLTATALINDRLRDGDWLATLDRRQSLVGNLAAVALATARQVSGTRFLQPGLHRLSRLVVRYLADQFVFARTIESGLQRSRRHTQTALRFSFDMLGEGARDDATARRFLHKYQRAIEAVSTASQGGDERGASPGVSVKLSALHPRFEHRQRRRVIAELLPRLKSLALQAKAGGIALTVDAEEANRLDVTRAVVEALFLDPDLRDWEGLGIAIQAYQKRAPDYIDWAIALAGTGDRRLGVRLVKGAYWDAEIKSSQLGGFIDYPVFTHKGATDLCYLICAERLLRARNRIYPQFATHNALSIAAVLALDDRMSARGAARGEHRSGYEFQRLHGMGERLHRQVIRHHDISSRVYAPVGDYRDVLPYLIRRLLENGANNSFVRQSAAGPSRDLTAALRTWGRRSDTAIDVLSRPPAIYSQRKNARGLDLDDDIARAPLDRLLSQWRPADYRAADRADKTDPMFQITNPANTRQLVGVIDQDTPVQMLGKLARSDAAVASWSQTTASERAALARRLADVLEAEMASLVVLLVKEAGRSIDDSVAEVREAVDFCRYYAVQAEYLYHDDQNRHVRPLGVVLCISPWNFPMAIFLGQVIAALLAGNTVLAKPAEQTCLIAQRVKQLMTEAGFHDDVMQLILSPGPLAGRTLVPQAAIKGILFTGSLATARWLAEQLAQRDDRVPLVAETGGQNALIADATALPEQVVDDIVRSAFHSAGQRCSSARVLYLQDEIADTVIEMLRGAMNELTVGDPALLTTDVGPIIDQAALERLHQHLDYLRSAGDAVRQIHETPLDPATADGHFFAPRLYEIPGIGVLKDEVFGPVLHVIRFGADALDEVVNQINSTGFGLTAGIHTRIEARAEYLARRLQAGNIYINRNMIGAVVGVQPFGGRGLSGTGPKAGGPDYLEALVRPANDSGDPIAYPTGSPPLAKPRETPQDLPAKQAHFADILGRLERSQGQFRSVTYSRMRDAVTFVAQRYWLEHELPGPVGERNRLLYEPRGQVVAVSGEQTNPDALLFKLWLCLLAGNNITLLAEGAGAASAEQMRDALMGAGVTQRAIRLSVNTETEIARPSTKAVMIDSTSPHVRAIHQSLLHHQRALCPLITDSDMRQILRQLVHEKSISINTAAVGGVTELLGGVHAEWTKQRLSEKS